ncbi:MAG: hypothetical protein BRC29_03100 [Nanohaloarchaea archaeon SW_7_43_1]|nr:MAG: hypothetical protein BRC29_03100 [Nanohaloarchaea archaeon SW_7_43_1]
MSKVDETEYSEFSRTKVRKTAENSDHLPDSFKIIEYREQFYAVDIDGKPETFYDAFTTNYDPSEDVELDAFVYNETADEFKEVSENVVNKILEGRLGI